MPSAAQQTAACWRARHLAAPVVPHQRAVCVRALMRQRPRRPPTRAAAAAAFHQHPVSHHHPQPQPLALNPPLDWATPGSSRGCCCGAVLRRVARQPRVSPCPRQDSRQTTAGPKAVCLLLLLLLLGWCLFLGSCHGQPGARLPRQLSGAAQVRDTSLGCLLCSWPPRSGCWSGAATTSGPPAWRGKCPRTTHQHHGCLWSAPPRSVLATVDARCRCHYHCRSPPVAHCLLSPAAAVRARASARHHRSCAPSRVAVWQPMVAAQWTRRWSC